MEFNMDELDRVIMNQQYKASNHHAAKDSSSIPTETEPMASNEPQVSMITNDHTNREYCLIIFNNPRWSQHLQQKSTRDKQQQSTEAIIVKNEPQDLSLDDIFIGQLRELINSYMLRTQRPFPIKYFLNFTPH